MAIACSTLNFISSACPVLKNLGIPCPAELVKKVAIVAVVGISLHWTVKALKRRSRNQRRSQYKKDVVILHQIDRSTTHPSISSYALKLETYLRIAKIPYENDFLEPFGPKGKCPWITYNGVDVADSDFCIEFLNRTFRVDLDRHLKAGDKAVGRCLAKTAEYNFIFCAAMWRFGYDKDMMVFKICPNFPSKIIKLFPCIAKRILSKVGYYQGIGRHSQQEVYEIGINDLKAFSAYLGDNKYFLGNTVSEVDCNMFSVLAQCVWGLPNSPFESVVATELQNLRDYCLRMKAEFWGDWNDNLYKS